ncbi:MAG: hypothetical protein E2593_05110 [Stenotrophomonas sp.]|nr:hypothetical protein [Stenotrophomonas sp.]
MATLVGAGAVQVAAQVLDTTVQADVLDTGEPVAEGHVQLVVWDSVITPLWPEGQGVDVRVAVVAAGATQAFAQVLTTLRTAPVSASADQAL